MKHAGGSWRPARDFTSERNERYESTSDNKTHIHEKSFTALTTAAVLLISDAATAADLTGNIQSAGKPIAGSTVTLFAAGTGAPTQLAQGKTDDSGAFTLTYSDAPTDSVLYVIATGGTPKAAAAKAPNDAIALLAVQGATPPGKVVVNEFSTVASLWTSAHFLKGGVLSGTKLGLRIAAGNVQNFVDLTTGSYGGTNFLSPRPTPFIPYLTFAPSAWGLPLKFTGGGLSAPGKLMIDSEGNVWAANNFLLGGQNQDNLWNGGLSKFAPRWQAAVATAHGFSRRRAIGARFRTGH